MAAERRARESGLAPFVALLFVLYPINRFLVEFTRGDNVRGHIPASVPLLGGLSTSQGISAAILPVGLLLTIVAFHFGRKRVARLRAAGVDGVGEDALAHRGSFGAASGSRTMAGLYQPPV